MTFPSWRDWLFSAKSFAASMMALFIALSLDLQRPYWAMAAVYVVSNPLAGATSSRGIYRALGTVLGATAAVVFVPVFVNSSELLALVVALWTGTLLFISMLDRSARSYVFMLAGYTLPLIALPTVDAPGTVFDVALSRSEEILLGITCASLVSSLVFPTSVGTVFGARISSWLKDAGIWAADILNGEGASPATPLHRQRLAADIAGLDLVISQLRYDAETRAIVRQARELRGRMLMLLPVFSSLADRLHGLKSADGALSAEMTAVLSRVAGYIDAQQRSVTPDEAEHITAEINRLKQTDLPSGWSKILHLGALHRLQDILHLWNDCIALRDQIKSGRQIRSWRPAFKHRRVATVVRHHDYGLLLFSASSVVVATLLATMAWIATGWSSGAGMVTMVAVGCSFFATLDRPAPLLKSMMIWTMVSVAASFVYLFGILPAVTSYEMLVVVFAPPFLLMGVLVPKPQYFLLALLTCVNTASFIALQDRFSADFVSLVEGGLSSSLGLAFALTWTMLTKPFGAELAARRLTKAGWRDLAETAAGRGPGDYERLSGRILDRLGQLAPRLAGISDRELQKVDGFAEVRLGFNVIVLQRERKRLLASGIAVDAVLDGVAQFYVSRLKNGDVAGAPPALLEQIDGCLRLLVHEDTAVKSDAMDSLVGLRRILFPDAAPPNDWPGPQRQQNLLSIAAE